MFYQTPYNDRHMNMKARVCLRVGVNACLSVSLIPLINTIPNGKSMTNLLPHYTFGSYLPIASLPNQ